MRDPFGHGRQGQTNAEMRAGEDVVHDLDRAAVGLYEF